MQSIKKIIKGWANYPTMEALVIAPTTIEELQITVKQHPQLLARGAGKSYGDSSLFNVVLSMLNFNKILEQNEAWIEVEAGSTIEQVLQQTVPNGKFLPVTPGVKSITIGGAIASNVHGKNHIHKGSFGNHVLSIKMLNENGDIIDCTPTVNKDVFFNLFGAMGLNGIVVSAKLKLIDIETSYLKEEQFFTNTINGLFQLFEAHKTKPFIVGWLDLLNTNINLNCIVKSAKWALKNETTDNKKQLAVNHKAPINIPFNFPVAPPRFAFKWYNKLYFLNAKKKPVNILHYNDFFYPLESINNWNRIFGPKGFVQYHAVLPMHNSLEGIKEIVDIVRLSKATCTLAVIKIFGKENELMPNSFPMEGYNIAMDFLNNRHLKLTIKQLDLTTAKFNGRIYKTKDSLSTLPLPIPSTKFQSDQNIRYGN